MKKIIKNIFATACIGLLAFGSANAQQVNTLYFLENAPMRHYINPALQPLSGVYISLPVIGYTSLWAGNNSLSLKDVIYNQNGQTILFMNPNGNTDKFYNRLKSNTLVNVDAQINLLSFGWRWNDAYWHITLNERIDGMVGVPKDLFNFAFNGMSDLDGGNNNFNLRTLGADVAVYTELGLGYSRILNEKWTIGGKLKFLYGNAFVSVRSDNMDLNLSASEWNLKGQGSAYMAGPVKEYPASIKKIADTKFEGTDNWQSYLKPSGLGAAIDLGLTYKPIEMLTFSASVTDLGFISWYKGQKYGYTVDGTYDGVGELKYEDYVTADNKFDSKALKDTVMNRLENVYNNMLYENGMKKGFTRMISAKVNIGADVNFFDNRLGAGIHSRTKIYNKKLYEELTLGVAYRPVNWFNIAASYSFFNGRWSSIGAAIGLRGGPLNLTLSADYIPFTYASYETDNGSKVSIPYKTEGLNVAVGLNLVFMNKQDKDKDGVKDRKDLCPDTPLGVTVDENGCPIDSDGDGVPDYLDQCPGTPAEAYGMITEAGCPKDTDGDGIPDYLDKCPGTPEAAYGQVDEFGCPKDTDLDGVPDYLDECPDTPREAYGHVDEKGCPKDTDGDGVFDYIDRCPDTPKEAYGQVDEYGCPKDTDLDGVPDYIDQCPNTVEAARNFVDSVGCDKDTDGDGVADYLDNCPRTPGTISNHGCPEVKKEVRNLFKKALQGIQFETGKAIIKPQSYALLNQIAQVFIDNPTYNVEVQGHTDSQGNDELNQTLSEKRANAVRDYLIKAGVSAGRMTARGYGETVPVADNKTSKGRAQNRRVEFIVSFEEITYE